MYVSSVIVEQLDLDRKLYTFRMQANYREQIVIAFPNEYEEFRSGPFHFLEGENEHAFKTGFADCRGRQVSEDRFKKIGHEYAFQTSWCGIPTERQELSYYALSLPEYAIPTQVRFSDPRSSREFRKTVEKDLQRNRFILYLECRSKHGSFDFVLHTKFSISSANFPSEEYYDDTTTEYGVHHDWNMLPLDDQDRLRVEQVFKSSRDLYIIGNAGAVGAVGPDSTARNNIIGNQNANEIELSTLADELLKLSEALQKQVTLPEHRLALTSVKAASEAAKRKDSSSVNQHLKSAGKWALETAIKIGANSAATVIENALKL